MCYSKTMKILYSVIIRCDRVLTVFDIFWNVGCWGSSKVIGLQYAR